jgi:hypothetical protein
MPSTDPCSGRCRGSDGDSRAWDGVTLPITELRSDAVCVPLVPVPALTVDAWITLASGQSPGGPIAVDSANVYWVNRNGNVMDVPVGGGTASTLATGQGNYQGVGVEGLSVYWTNFGSTSSGGTVLTMSLDGGAISTLVSGQSNPAGSVVDPTSVYWGNSGSCPTDGGPCNGEIMKLTPK